MDGTGPVMMVRVIEKGISVELSCAEARFLLEEIAEVPARGRPKIKQLYEELERTLRFAWVVLEEKQKGAQVKWKLK